MKRLFTLILLLISLSAVSDAFAQGIGGVDPFTRVELATEYVFFNANSAKIKDCELANVESIVMLLRNYPKSEIEIRAYCRMDTRNLNEVCRNRAMAIRNYLVNECGVDPDRISVEAKGIGNMFEDDRWNDVVIYKVFKKQRRNYPPVTLRR